MLLEIDDSKTISDLQEKFSLCFPDLKIEFCRKSHHWEELSDLRKFLPAGIKIESIRYLHDPGILEIRSEHKVGEVEKRFHQRFGLNVQVLFKGNGKWIQTGKLDNLTIRELQSQTTRHMDKLIL